MSWLFRKISKIVITLEVESYNSSIEPLDDFMGAKLLSEGFFIFNQPSEKELRLVIHGAQDESRVLDIFTQAGLRAKIIKREQKFERQYGPPKFCFSSVSD